MNSQNECKKKKNINNNNKKRKFLQKAKKRKKKIEKSNNLPKCQVPTNMILFFFIIFKEKLCHCIFDLRFNLITSEVTANKF